MKSFIRNLPVPVEFIVVVSLWLDPMLIGGCFGLRKFLHSGFWEVNNALLIRVAILQVMALAVIIWIGNIRGWTLQKLGIRISWKGTGGGILLAAVSYAATYGVWTIYELIIPPKRLSIIVTGLAIPVIIATQIVNAVFEEVVEAGYFINTFSRFGMWFAILAGTLLRELYHLPLMRMEALLGLIPTFLMFGYVYWRWRQLWPLVVAHMLRDFYFLLYAVHHAA
jgi:hypothetical protein